MHEQGLHRWQRQVSRHDDDGVHTFPMSMYEWGLNSFSFRVLRNQLPLKNKYYSTTPPSDDPEVECELLHAGEESAA